MALVQYSDSESDTDDAQESPPRPAKKTRQDRSTPNGDKLVSSLPPLPTAFHDLYAASTRVSVRDDPTLHGGRKRLIPHIEGNWPTHIYLEWYPSKRELPLLEDVISQSQDKLVIHSLLQSDLGVQLPLHISLSRPVVLQTEQRAPFTEAFKNAVQSSNIRPFDVTVESLDWVSNYEKTRWFLVLRVRRPENDSLNHLLRLSNRSLAVFGQPPLYETWVQSSETHGEPKGSAGLRENQANAQAHVKDFSDCFHISVAWSLTEPALEDRERVANVDLQRLRDLKIRFASVKAKIGNNISSIPLSAETIHERGFGGL